MKKELVFSLLAAGMLTMTGCGSSDGDTTPTVPDIFVSEPSMVGAYGNDGREVQVEDGSIYVELNASSETQGRIAQAYDHETIVVGVDNNYLESIDQGFSYSITGTKVDADGNTVLTFGIMGLTPVVTMMTQDEATTTDFNTNSKCGITNWQVNVPQDVSGIIGCDDSAKYYLPVNGVANKISIVVDGNIWFDAGDSPIGDDGYPTTLDYDFRLSTSDVRVVVPTPEPVLVVGVDPIQSETSIDGTYGQIVTEGSTTTYKEFYNSNGGTKLTYEMDFDSNTTDPANNYIDKTVIIYSYTITGNKVDVDGNTVLTIDFNEFNAVSTYMPEDQATADRFNAEVMCGHTDWIPNAEVDVYSTSGGTCGYTPNPGSILNEIALVYNGSMYATSYGTQDANGYYDTLNYDDVLSTSTVK